MIILFDIGGVLIKGRISHLYESLAKRLHVHPQALFEAKDLCIDDAIIGKVTMEEMLEKIGVALNIEPARLKEEWRKAFYETLTVDEDVRAIIERLKDGNTVHALTNVIELDTESCRIRGDYACFERLFTSWELGCAKPAMEIFHQVLRELRADPAECVFIDDNAENCLAAASVGMRTIHFQNAAQLKTDLHRMGLL